MRGTQANQTRGQYVAPAPDNASMPFYGSMLSRERIFLRHRDDLVRKYRFVGATVRSISLPGVSLAGYHAARHSNVALSRAG
ncbi:MAG: hypothetical protein C4346_11940 [Chloroflexota bacterium]